MINNLESLLKYNESFKDADFGDYIDLWKDETTGVLHVGGMRYSDLVDSFLRDLYSLINSNRHLHLTDYQQIIEENGAQFDDKDLSSLNAQYILALIVRVVRADRFCEGTLLDNLESGYIQMLLERLAENANG
ncbi:MAG: hypothetical protein GX994_03755 [Firmicutes bacterium]|nr:hypothetical protein [Bacillota bacterium]